VPRDDAAKKHYHRWPMTFRKVRDSASQWLARRVPPSPAIRPYPGWRLGSGERGSGSVATWFRRQLWYSIDSPVVTPWICGLRVYACPRNEISRSLFVTGQYEPNEFNFLSRTLQPGMVFVDVGANMGLYTLFAARTVGDQGRVVAVEPSARECERLLLNVRANGLANVQLVQRAASDSVTEMDLLIAADDWSGHNTLGAFTYETSLAVREKVRTERLDAIVEQAGLLRVDVIKMDVEGAEVKALHGAVGTLERFRPVLLIEFADRALRHQGGSGGQLWEFLQQRHYRLYEFDARTGEHVPAQRKPEYDSENLIAMPGSTWPTS
jgi:FkbM family methyltransferase